MSDKFEIPAFGVSKARFILVALICASPAMIVWDGLVIQGLIALVVAIALAIVASTLRPAETDFLLSTVRPIAAVAVIPALWIVVQVLPIKPLAHPIWTSLETALGHPISGAISIKPSASVIALGQYLSVAAIAFVSAAVAVDRSRAEWILFALTGATAAIALILLIDDLAHPVLKLTPFKKAEAMDCAAFGVIVTAAACIRSLERYETRRASPFRSVPLLIGTFSATATALLICIVTLAWGGTREILFATACGFAALIGAVIVRRIRLGIWYATMMFATTLVAGVLLISPHCTEGTRSFLLAFAVSPTSVSERMLEDAPLVGTGAGTFSVLAPIYREIDETLSDSVASTAAANIAIEVGQPILWLIAVATIVLIIVLLRASLQRGRDSFYSAMGGACLITMMLLAFVDAGLLGISTGVIAATVLGLAIAQSKSRTTRS